MEIFQVYRDILNLNAVARYAQDGAALEVIKDSNVRVAYCLFQKQTSNRLVDNSAVVAWGTAYVGVVFSNVACQYNDETIVSDKRMFLKISSLFF